MISRLIRGGVRWYEKRFSLTSYSHFRRIILKCQPPPFPERRGLRPFEFNLVFYVVAANFDIRTQKPADQKLRWMSL